MELSYYLTHSWPSGPILLVCLCNQSRLPEHKSIVSHEARGKKFSQSKRVYVSKQTSIEANKQGLKQASKQANVIRERQWGGKPQTGMSKRKANIKKKKVQQKEPGFHCGQKHNSLCWREPGCETKQKERRKAKQLTATGSGGRVRDKQYAMYV